MSDVAALRERILELAEASLEDRDLLLDDITEGLSDTENSSTWDLRFFGRATAHR